MRTHAADDPWAPRIDSLLSALHSRGWDDLDPQDQAFLCVWRLDAEVANGGLLQFFANGGRALTPETIEALGMIGAPRTAAILSRAQKLFPAEAVSADAVGRDEIRELDELDAEFQTTGEDLGRCFLHYLDHED